MPFTHVDSDTPRTPTKRKLPFPDSIRSPPALRDIISPVTPVSVSIPATISAAPPATAPSRLTPNPYSAEKMTTVPQPQRVSPIVPGSPSRRGNETLPSIRDIIPELPALAAAPPASSSQSCGPDAFQPSAMLVRPTVTGLAPSPLTSARKATYQTPEITPGVPVTDRQYANSAPAGSRSSTTRSSPIQPLSGPLPPRSEPVRALPPLSAGFSPPETSRGPPYGPYSASSVPPPPPPPPSAHWQGQSNAFRPGPPVPYGQPHGHHMPTNSPSYSHYENSDYGSDGKSKRRRGNLPKQVTDTLRKWFNEHIAHPYPTEDEKMMLMNATNLTMSQISNWFINARRRSMPQQIPRDAVPDVRDAVPVAYMSDRV